MRPAPARRRTRFGRWLDGYGLDALRRDLHAAGLPLLTVRAVQHWQAGRALPRVEAIAIIEKLSGGRVHMRDVLQHRDAMRARSRMTQETRPVVATSRQNAPTPG